MFLINLFLKKVVVHDLSYRLPEHRHLLVDIEQLSDTDPVVIDVSFDRPELPCDLYPKFRTYPKWFCSKDRFGIFMLMGAW